MNKTVIIYIGILCILGCKVSKKNISQDLIISIEKTACMGPCPVYKLSIFSDGTLQLSAKKNLELKGEFSSTLTNEELQSLIDKFVESDFFAFKESYESNMTDLPSTFIEFNYEGKSKKILDYDGAPKELKALEAEVIALLKSSDWKLIEYK